MGVICVLFCPIVWLSPLTVTKEDRGGRQQGREALTNSWSSVLIWVIKRLLWSQSNRTLLSMAHPIIPALSPLKSLLTTVHTQDAHRRRTKEACRGKLVLLDIHCMSCICNTLLHTYIVKNYRYQLETSSWLLLAMRQHWTFKDLVPCSRGISYYVITLGQTCY